jgi:hypothetical protein
MCVTGAATLLAEIKSAVKNGANTVYVLLAATYWNNNLGLALSALAQVHNISPRFYMTSMSSKYSSPTLSISSVLSQSTNTSKVIINLCISYYVCS